MGWSREWIYTVIVCPGSYLKYAFLIYKAKLWQSNRGFPLAIVTYLICIITRGLCSYNARLFNDDVTWRFEWLWVIQCLLCHVIWDCICYSVRGLKRQCWTTDSWRCQLSLEIASSIPNGSAGNLSVPFGFICVSLNQSIKITLSNMHSIYEIFLRVYLLWQLNVAEYLAKNVAIIVAHINPIYSKHLRPINIFNAWQLLFNNTSMWQCGTCLFILLGLFKLNISNTWKTFGTLLCTARRCLQTHAYVYTHFGVELPWSGAYAIGKHSFLCIGQFVKVHKVLILVKRRPTKRVQVQSNSWRRMNKNSSNVVFRYYIDTIGCVYSHS